MSRSTIVPIPQPPQTIVTAPVAPRFWLTSPGEPMTMSSFESPSTSQTASDAMLAVGWAPWIATSAVAVPRSTVRVWALIGLIPAAVRLRAISFSPPGERDVGALVADAIISSAPNAIACAFIVSVAWLPVSTRNDSVASGCTNVRISSSVPVPSKSSVFTPTLLTFGPE